MVNCINGYKLEKAPANEQESEKNIRVDTVKFEELGLSQEIQKAVKHMGFEEASPIQAKAIPVMMQGKDMIGQAQTGTGKTAAFGIPLLEKIDPRNKKIQSIVLCPTRELAIQVADEIRQLAKYLHGIKILPIYGGQEISTQIRSLKSGVQLVIGTPGRVMDHMRRKTIRLEHMHTIVLDEADEMLNMGFREDIETILKETSSERQTVLFSATMPPAIMEITKLYQQNAEIVKVVKRELTVPNIEQFYYEVKPKNKQEVLARLLDIYVPKLSVVFCNTKKQVDLLVNDLLGRGYFAAGLHGDMKQTQRERVMQAFRKQKTNILVATDVAARGIDVDEVEAVFNYDLPQDDEYYVHRIGRTGRAGRVGRSFSFVCGREIYKLKEIQRYCRTKIYARKIPSISDVTNTKMENLLAKMEDTINNGNLTQILEAIQDKANESDYTTMEMAAALLKMCLGEETKSKDIDYGNTGSSEEGMVRLFLSVGKKDKARPKDILGALTGESSIRGESVGTIAMYDKYSFVDVPQKDVEDMLRSMRDTKIKGKRVSIELANSR